MKIIGILIVSIFLIVISTDSESSEKARLKNKYEYELITSDGGIIWHVEGDKTQHTPVVNSAKIEMKHSEAIIIKNGVRKTTDGGKTWSTSSEVNDNTNNNCSVSIFPNPVTTEKMSVTIPQLFSYSVFTITINNLHGNCCLKALSSDFFNNNGSMEINVSELSSGQYYLVLSDGNSSFVESFKIVR